jgi:hypothetical protein
MATKHVALDYTDAELLALCKQAIADLTIFSSTTFRDKTVTRANLSDLLKLRDDLDGRIRKAAGAMTTVYTKHTRCY